MKVETLIAKLQKLNPKAEAYIDQECAMPITDVEEGYYVDNEFDAPEVLCITEDEFDDYGIPEGGAEKVVVIS
jgi:hypothetical protein